MSWQTTGRRTFLRSASVGGVVGLAGCLDRLGGGGDGDLEYDTELIAVSHESGSATHTLTQGIGTTVNENTDEINIDVRPSDGPDDNIGRMDRGEAHIGFLNPIVARGVHEGVEPYDGVNIRPQQLVSVLVAPWIFATTDPEVETIADIGSEHDIFAGPSGSGTRQLFERALELYEIEGYSIRDMPFTEQAGALSEGRIDVGITNALNYEVEPAWVQEMKASTDLGIVEWPDGGQRIQDDDMVDTTKWETGKLENYELRDPPETYVSVTELYNHFGRADIPDDMVTLMLETMHENVEEMAEHHALLGFHQSDEFWVSAALDEVPFHPAAADFYEDLGVWNDDWTRGE